MNATSNDDYNPQHDFWKGWYEALAVVRERVKGGGATWEPKMKNMTTDYYTIVDDEGTYQVRASLRDPTHATALIAKLQEVHEKLLAAYTAKLEKEPQT